MTEDYPTGQILGARHAPHPLSSPTPQVLGVSVVSGRFTEAAFDLARDLLAQELPERWAHCQGAGAGASRLAPILGRRLEVVRASALLHDIGYAPALAHTRFHPLDGARYLRGLGVDERIVSLVAHHTFALLEANLRCLSEPLEKEFELPPMELQDAMVYCDMTSAVNGRLIDPRVRMAEIMIRYGADSVVGRYISRAETLVYTSLARVAERMETAGEAN